MPIAIIIAAFFSLLVAVGVRNFSPAKTAPIPTPTPTIVVSMPAMSATVIPTRSVRETVRPTSTQASNTPTPTQRPVINVPAVLPLATNTPTPNPDTQAPTVDYMTGPGEGTTVDFNSFCFPMKFSDASSPILVRYGMDVSSPSDWNQNYAPCYSSISNGAHTFMVQAKDSAGNMTSIIKRSFIVNIANPTNRITVSPTPGN